MKQNYRLYHTILVSALLILGLGLGLEVSAADQNPCSEDIAKFCKDVGPGRGAVMACLEKYEGQLSDACKDYEAKMERPRAESREAAGRARRIPQVCANEIAKFCGTVKSGIGGMAACLEEHANELSVPCKEALVAARGAEEGKITK